MFGFKIHMAGLDKEESYIVNFDNKLTVQYKDLVVIANDSPYSFAKVGNSIYIMVQDGCHYTAILTSYGMGVHACYTSNIGGLVVGEEILEGRTVIHATDLDELDVNDYVKEDLVEILKREWMSMDDGYGNNYNPMMTASEEVYLQTRERIKNM